MFLKTSLLKLKLKGVSLINHRQCLCDKKGKVLTGNCHCDEGCKVLESESKICMWHVCFFLRSHRSYTTKQHIHFTDTSPLN